MNNAATRPPVSGLTRLPAQSFLLTGHALDLVLMALRSAQRARARDGLSPSTGWAALVNAMGGAPHGNEPAAEEAATISTREAAELLGVNARTVRRKAPALGGRLVGGSLVLDRMAVLEHRVGRDLL